MGRPETLPGHRLHRVYYPAILEGLPLCGSFFIPPFDGEMGELGEGNPVTGVLRVVIAHDVIVPRGCDDHNLFCKPEIFEAPAAVDAEHGPGLAPTSTAR